MANIPIIETKRLRLRPFTLHDAPEVQSLAGNKSIADTTLNIPDPYKDGVAEEWISTHQNEFLSGKGVTLAITQKTNSKLVGAISLMKIMKHHQAEIGLCHLVRIPQDVLCNRGLKLAKHGSWVHPEEDAAQCDRRKNADLPRRQVLGQST